SPAQYYTRGLDMDEIVQGAAEGFARAQRERGTRVNLAFDYGRQFGVDMAWQILEVAVRNQTNTLIGWSIGGDEVGHPPEPFAEVFAAARRAGLRTMAHAGEVVGPKSVWGAAEALKCERLGHGIRSADDPQLLKYLREHDVTLDVSPTSNVRTGAVADIGAHPLRKLYDAGVPVTLNTDDPIFFGTTLVDEYRLAAREFGFDVAELAQISLNGARAVFLPDDERNALVERFTDELDRLRAELGV
ncbi:MAG TPA: adenosine deaminase family protein, partial [Roseiflexaceae bacterium]|nr:adenosine deaminase family protein [Roseiflexaceae bacterium]